MELYLRVSPPAAERPLRADYPAEQGEHLPVVPEWLAGALADFDALRIAPGQPRERIARINDASFGYGGDGPEQIGRASCRERVFGYV